MCILTVSFMFVKYSVAQGLNTLNTGVNFLKIMKDKKAGKVI